jgi:hypothetical protein
MKNTKKRAAPKRKPANSKAKKRATKSAVNPSSSTRPIP